MTFVFPICLCVTHLNAVRGAATNTCLRIPFCPWCLAVQTSRSKGVFITFRPSRSLSLISSTTGLQELTEVHGGSAHATCTANRGRWPLRDGVWRSDWWVRRATFEMLSAGPLQVAGRFNQQLLISLSGPYRIMPAARLGQGMSRVSDNAIETEVTLLTVTKTKNNGRNRLIPNSKSATEKSHSGY